MGADHGDDDDDVDRFYRCLSMSRDVDIDIVARMGADQGDDDDVDRFYRCLSTSIDVDYVLGAKLGDDDEDDIDRFYRCLSMSRVTLQLWTCVKYVPKQSIP